MRLFSFSPCTSLQHKLYTLQLYSTLLVFEAKNFFSEQNGRISIQHGNLSLYCCTTVIFLFYKKVNNFEVRVGRTSSMLSLMLLLHHFTAGRSSFSVLSTLPSHAFASVLQLICSSFGLPPLFPLVLQVLWPMFSFSTFCSFVPVI